MALRIIILDDDSQVGSALFELVDGMPGLECRVIPARLLSTSPEGVLQRVRVFMPHYVVNSHSIEQALAAEGVDRAHLRLAKMLCQDCRSCGAAMIHLSSALVFEGARGQSFSEADKPRPRRSPGRRLLELERIVERHSDRYIILRTGWIFGANRQSSFVKLLERLDPKPQTPNPYKIFSVGEIFLSRLSNHKFINPNGKNAWNRYFSFSFAIFKKSAKT